MAILLEEILCPGPLAGNAWVFLGSECGHQTLPCFVSNRSGPQAEKCCAESCLGTWIVISPKKYICRWSEVRGETAHCPLGSALELGLYETEAAPSTDLCLLKAALSVPSPHLS